MSKGKILEKALEETGYNIGKLAEKIKVGRRTIYNWIDTDTVSLETLLYIGKIIKYDFTEDIPELKELSEMFAKNQELEYKEKYYQLLEDYVTVVNELNEAKAHYEAKPIKTAATVKKKAAPSEPSAPKVRQTKKKK